MAPPETRGKEGQALEKKLHVGVDDRGQIVASTVTESNEQDPSQVPELLDQIGEEIGRFIGDGIYDGEPVYTAVKQHSPGARVIIPPRKDAVLSPTASTAPTQRDQHLLEIERDGRFVWKRTSGYYDQSRAENAFSRFKLTFGDRLRAKRDESQAREASLGYLITGYAGSHGCSDWYDRNVLRNKSDEVLSNVNWHMAKDTGRHASSNPRQLRQLSTPRNGAMERRTIRHCLSSNPIVSRLCTPRANEHRIFWICDTIYQRDVRLHTMDCAG